FDVDVAAAEHAHEDIIHEGSRLQGRLAVLATEQARRHATQVRIHQRQQPIERIGLSRLPLMDELGDFAGTGGHDAGTTPGSESQYCVDAATREITSLWVPSSRDHSPPRRWRTAPE